MVARFKYRRNYPGQFAKSLADNQSAVPSQFSPVPAAYDPSKQPDVIPTDPVQVSDISIVRSTFDSRLPYSYDWYWEDCFFTGISTTDGYTVPLGFVLILRNIEFTIFPSEGEVHSDELITPYGGPVFGAGFNIFININNAGAPTWTQRDPINNRGVTWFNPFAGPLNIETFVLVNQQTNLNIAIPLVTSPDGVSHTVYDLNVRYYGNMIQATGRPLVSEVGNFDPLMIRKPNI